MKPLSTQRFLVQFFLSLGLLFHACAGHAMRIAVEGSRLYAAGEITADDAMELMAALDNPDLRTVVLVKSPGGTLQVGLGVGQMIRHKRLNTVAAGECVSSCSLMFVAGVERRFSALPPPAASYIGIHGASLSVRGRFTGQADLVTQNKLFEHFQTMLGDKFPAELIREALQDMDNTRALLVIPENLRRPADTRYCRAGLQRPESCKVYPNDSALTMGVITTSELDTTPIPRYLAEQPSYMGVSIPAAIYDMKRELPPLVRSACATDECPDKLSSSYRDAQAFKALAVATAEPGWAIIGNAASSTHAAERALFACNHPQAQRVRLCELRVINNQSLQRTHQYIAELHSQALRQITALPQPEYADELQGAEFAVPDRPQAQWDQSLTPLRLNGIQTLSTQQVSRMLREQKIGRLIDVGAGPESLPTAQTLRHGGLAFADSRDAQLEERFDALLQKYLPSKTSPVVFFDHLGPKGWLAVNAALRAKALGYSKVYWYRGGLPSWGAAQLPRPPQQLQAVVH